jgi:hypothetical protein
VYFVAHAITHALPRNIRLLLTRDPNMKKFSRRSKARRQLFVEGLERRELLAGNVLVTLNNGSLTVTGDNASNFITIYQQTNGQFTIEGQDGEEFTGPTTGIVARSITVNLGAGDDAVTIAAQPVEAGEDLLPATLVLGATVNGGDGSDVIAVSVVGRRLGDEFVIPTTAITVDGGAPAPNSEASQDDIVSIENSSATLVTVRTGIGDDAVNLFNVLAVTLLVDTGVPTLPQGATDADQVNAQTVTAATATINLGLNSDDNSLVIDTALTGVLSAFGGNGVDLVAVTNTLTGLAGSIYTYGGADNLTLVGLQAGLTPADYQAAVDLIVERFGLDLSLLPFNLNNLIAALPALPGFLTVSTGDGADVVTADDLFSTMAIYIYLDGGDDQLSANDVEATFAWFFGGAGIDGRIVTNVDALSELELQFENILPDLN